MKKYAWPILFNNAVCNAPDLGRNYGAAAAISLPTKARG